MNTLINNKKRVKKYICLTLALAILASVLTQFTALRNTGAISNWDAGNIMSDAIMSNSSTMSTAQIQSFLNSKVTSCDTNGQQLSEFGGPDLNGDGKVQRWEYGKSRYNQTTFPCLKDYVISGKKAAQIIYEKAQKYRINPQVLIVLLQKEQSLVTDTWPLNIQYRSATGYGCPDTAPCDTQYYGLPNQLDWAAKMFRSILNDSPDWYTPYNLGWNYIQYNPSASCGGSNVYIKNRATQALYNYTPYQPNKAALNAGWGSASCGAYGNRNFYLYFTQWFGNINGGELTAYDIKIISPITITAATGNASTVSFTVKNTSSTRKSFDKTIVQCRNYQKQNCDSNVGGAWFIDPNQERIFSYTIDISRANTYTLTPYIYMNNTWYRYDTDNGNTKNTISTTKTDIRIESQILTNPMYLSPNTNATVSFKIKNYGGSPIRLDQTVVQCRYEGTNCDSNYGGPITVLPSESKTFNYSIESTSGGNYYIIPYFMFEGIWYQYKQSGSFLPNRTINVADLELDENGITAQSETPITGESVQVDFNAINNGAAAIQTSRIVIQCRYNTIENCDPSFTTNDVIDANELKSYSSTFKLEKAGTYKFTPYFEYMNKWVQYPSTGNNNTKTLNVSKYYADMRLEGDIQLNPVNPKPGDDVTVSYTVKNFGTKPAYYQRSILQCRLNAKINCDPAYNQRSIVILPGESRTFVNNFTSISTGTYKFTPYFEQNNEWRMYVNGSANDNKKSIFINPLTLTSPITITPTSPSPNSIASATYRVKNHSSKSITIAKSVLQCRIGTINCDSATSSSLTFSPGQEREFTQTFRVSSAGSYRLVPYYHLNKSWYTYGYLDGITPEIMLSVE